MYKLGLISLGCSKNTVDSEAILGMLNQDKFEIVTDLNVCDLIIINTCGFIEDAKVEAINVIFEALEYHKKTIVVGCLVERYKKELEEEFPEVDAFVAIKEYRRLPTIINDVLNDVGANKNFDIFNRILSTPDYHAYLKISEGCNNFCTFCSIPYIRGRFHSFKMDELLNYTKDLAKKGLKEVTIVSQDTVSYGKDFKDGTNLYKLLVELEKIEGLEFIRVLYTYPEGVTDEIIELIAKSNKICHYFDIPLQHCSTSVLKRMNRHDTKESIVNLYKRIRKFCPDAILRTTLMVGFSGETKEDFEELKSFISEVKFNHLGCFTFSKEEGTRAATFDDNVPQEEKDHRKDEIMLEQKKISYEMNKSLIGHEFKAIVINNSKAGEVSVRCDYNAPDDIDGSVIVKTNKKHQCGDILKIKITRAFVYDLMAEEI